MMELSGRFRELDPSLRKEVPKNIFDWKSYHVVIGTPDFFDHHGSDPLNGICPGFVQGFSCGHVPTDPICGETLEFHVCSVRSLNMPSRLGIQENICGINLVLLPIQFL